MSRRLADDLGLVLETTEEGARVRLTKDKLEAYGIEGKEFDAFPVSEVSTVIIEKDSVLQPMEFFREKNPHSAIRNVEFPNKSKAFNINCICVDLDINFGATEQETLKQMRYFLKNSVLKTKLNRTDHLSIPLIDCVPFAIEYDGSKYTTRMVRNGFMIQDGIKIAMSGEFEASIIPAPNYRTHSDNVNPEPEANNIVRLTLKGHSLQTVA